MLYKLLYSIIVVLAAIALANGLVEKTPYIIRNAENYMFLRSIGGGAICKSDGRVILSPTFDNLDSEKWIYNDIAGYSYFTLPAGGEYINEVSFDNPAPHCYPGTRMFYLIPVSETLFLMKTMNDQCLMSNGPGKNIEWAPCDSEDLKQQWNFKETSF